jgi:hypothetical protein
MAGKFITKTQQSHVAGLLTGVIAALDHKGYPWTKQHRQDIEVAYRGLGVPAPFEFKDVKPGDKGNKQEGVGILARIREKFGASA